LTFLETIAGFLLGNTDIELSQWTWHWGTRDSTKEGGRQRKGVGEEGVPSHGHGVAICWVNRLECHVMREWISNDLALQ